MNNIKLLERRIEAFVWFAWVTRKLRKYRLSIKQMWKAVKIVIKY